MGLRQLRRNPNQRGSGILCGGPGHEAEMGVLGPGKALEEGKKISRNGVLPARPNSVCDLEEGTSLGLFSHLKNGNE
jgi:hypothetical protein